MPEEVIPHNDEEMSDDEQAMWEEIGKDLQPNKVLDRLVAHQKSITSNLTTVSSLLAGFGGISAGVAINRDTWYLAGIPVIPVMALATSVLAGTAILLALRARSPRFGTANPQDAYSVRDYVSWEIDQNQQSLTTASKVFFAAAATATATAAVAGIVAVFDPTNDPTAGPRNLASLSATLGDKDAVTIHLGGSIENLRDDDQVSVTVTSVGTRGDDTDVDITLIDLDVYPDADGTVTFDHDGTAPINSAEATATITIKQSTVTEPESFTLDVSYPEVPAPTAADPTKQSQGSTESSDPADPAG